MFEGQRGKSDLWDRCRFVDPKYTKSYTGKGGFKGTSTNATYLIERATQEFGPVGTGWGWNVVDAYYIDGAPMVAQDGTNYGNEKLHVVRASVWYIENGVRSVGIEHFGQTSFISLQTKAIWKDNRRAGEREIPVSDEDHAKKSLTDAITKALSCLGFAADIHKGMWDDNKYVKEMAQEAQARTNGQQPTVQPDASARARRAEREKQIEEIKRDIRGNTTKEGITAAVTKGLNLAKSFGDEELHDEFRKIALEQWTKHIPKNEVEPTR